MATIRARRQSNGTLRYNAMVRIRKGKTLLHSESKTFSHRSAAERWARAREVALEDPAALLCAKQPDTSLAELIGWYIKTFEEVSRWQRSKQAQLKFLEKHPFCKIDVFSLTTAALVDHVTSRRAGGTGPASVANDLTWIGVVLRAAKSVKGLPVRTELVEEARTACRELRLIAKSRRRERRPTADELVKLDDFFRRRDHRACIPMRDIMWFAIHSARRESEICRLERADNETANRTGMVRDAKHPTSKEGNHRRFKYTLEAWDIVQRQSEQSPYVFPYNATSVCAAFTRACRVLGIVDLRFHDLRHEATSRLFERGYQIHEVAQFTLHESWNELKRYTNLRPEKTRDIPAPSPAESLSDKEIDGDKAKAIQTSRAADQSTAQGRRHSPTTVTSGRRA